MFNKIKFAQILKNISEKYDNQRDFSKKSNINRTYLSQYMNMKLEEPPKPKILQKLADASKGITSYYELMSICDYIRTPDLFSKEISPSLTKVFKDTFVEYGISNEDVNKIEAIIECNSETQDKEISDILSKYDDEVIENVFYTLQVNRQNLSNEIEIMRPIKQLLNVFSNNKIILCPIYGAISAGQPILADEYLEGYLPVDPNIYGITTPDDYFYLRVSGESMNLKIHNGDYALIHKQDYADNGDIVVAIVNGDDEATLKKYKKLTEELVMLEPMSTIPMEPIIVNIKDTNFKIIGKAIGHFGKF